MLPGRVQGPDRISGNSSVPYLPVMRQQTGQLATVPGARIGTTKEQLPFIAGNSAVYQNSQKVFRTLEVADGSIALLDEPDGVRVFLQIRNARSSAGFLNLSFSGDASNGDTCDYELEPGAAIAFEQMFLPQNRIFGAAIGGQVNWVISYADRQGANLQV